MVRSFTRFLRSTRGATRGSPTLPVVHRGCMSHWRVISIHLRCQTFSRKELEGVIETDSGLVPSPLFVIEKVGISLVKMSVSSPSLPYCSLPVWFRGHATVLCIVIYYKL